MPELKQESGDYFPFNLPEYKNPRVDLWRHIDANNLGALLSCFQPAEPVAASSILPLSDKSPRPLKKPPTSQTGLGLDQDQYQLFAGLITKLFRLHASDKRDQILIDNYYYLFKFAIANELSVVQISSLLSLMIKTHELAMETSFGNLDEVFDCFKKLLLGYAVHRPPFSLAIFSPREAEKIIAYFFNTYFKQFKLFKYIYTPAVRLHLRFGYTNLPPADASTSDKPLSNASKSECSNEGELADSSSTLTAAQLLGDSTSNVAQNELKSFIRQYLDQRVDKMKAELDDELKKTASELGVKPPPSNAKRQNSSPKRAPK